MFKSIFKRQIIPITLSLACGIGFMMYTKKSNAHAHTGHNQYVNYKTPVENEVPIKPVACQGSCIKLSLLLDTSSSMNGLIEQAKSQLWRITKELSATERNGEDIGLQIALYEYGNDRLDKSKGFIKQLCPLTTDIDLVSEKLFSLTTNGGSEHCGQVIKKSLDQLDWGDDKGELKLIYIAGNETFEQGPINYKKACESAKDDGIIVNTIFCGDYKTGINMKWKAGAHVTGGEYMNIDHNRQTVYYDAPQDDRLDVLNEELNKTYMSYNGAGAAKIQSMIANDSNAESYSKANKSDRIAFKSSKMYKNSEWDLLDAYEEKEEKVFDEIKELPSELKGKSKAEMKKILEEKKAKRAQIKEEIGKLSKERDAYIAKQRKKDNNDFSLDENILKSVKKQAASKGYSF